MKYWLSIALLWGSSALAGVDERFAGGVLGLEWGATLQQVQTLYPNGIAWPGSNKDFDGAIIYEVAGDSRMLGIRTFVQSAQFLFSPENKLLCVFFHFAFPDRDSVLFDAAEMLGQDYSSRNQTDSTTFTWKKGLSSIAQLRIGNAAQYPWVFLAVAPISSANRLRK